MVENPISKTFTGMMWKRTQYHEYIKLGLSQSTLKLIVGEIINPALRKINYGKYKETLRKHYLEHYNITLSEKTNPAWMKEVLFDGVYSQVEDFIPSKGSVVLDIGAQYGDFSILCAKKYEVGMVYSFEPISRNFNVMIENLALNEVSNFRAFNSAVGSKEGEIMIDGENAMASAFDQNPNCKVNLVSIDSMHLKHVDLIKIDVEGFEMEVLEGARNTITRDLPPLIIEVHSKLLKEEVLDFTGKLGYRLIHEDRPKSNRKKSMDMVQNLFLSL